MEHDRLATELNSHVVRAQRVLAEYVDPGGGLTEGRAINELLDILDHEDLIRLQERVPEKRALFVHS